MMSTFAEQQKSEAESEEKVRKLMLKQRITFHEAKALVAKGQRALFEF